MHAGFCFCIEDGFEAGSAFGKRSVGDADRGEVDTGAHAAKRRMLEEEAKGRGETGVKTGMNEYEEFLYGRFAYVICHLMDDCN